jgi:hypothetical protein
MTDSENKRFEVTEDGKLKKIDDQPADFEENLTFDG